MVTTGKTKKTSNAKVFIGNSKKEDVSDVVVEKNETDNMKSGVSVFTKTTNPRVVIQSENIDSFKHSQNQRFCRCNVFKSLYLIILGIIVLITFFLSLKTYDMVNKLYLLSLS